jgi:hypothetical protein
MIAYFKALAAKKYCKPYYDDYKDKTTLTCNCLEILGEDDAAQAVDAGALQFLKMNKAAQRVYLMTTLGAVLPRGRISARRQEQAQDVHLTN